MKKAQVDTKFEGSWADQEFKRTHKPIIRNDYCTNFKPVIEGWEKIHLPLPDWFGKPSILIKGISLGPIDQKWARHFNS
jgi:hypothetical protein